MLVSKETTLSTNNIKQLKAEMVREMEPEFFRLPPDRSHDPYFGLTRGWYYLAIKRGWIKSVALRAPGSIKGVRLISFQSVKNFLNAHLEEQKTA